MLASEIIRCSTLLNSRLFAPLVVQHTQKHTANCPVTKVKVKRCPGAGGLKRGRPTTKTIPLKRGLVYKPPRDDDVNILVHFHRQLNTSGETVQKRAIMPGKVRMAFIPEEWFRFLKPMTGVSGPYILMIGLANYLMSKEIFVMEHEYYMGISQFIMVYFAVTRFGPKLAAYLDKEVDDFTSELEKTRTDELNSQKDIIKSSETAIWRAQGQKDLMQAKKENIAIQLEAIYRERAMLVYQRVRGRLEYHVRKQRTENRVKQKWMVQWILNDVEKSITADFKKRAMESAILQLTALANRMPQK